VAAASTSRFEHVGPGVGYTCRANIYRADGEHFLVVAYSYGWKSSVTVSYLRQSVTETLLYRAGADGIPTERMPLLVMPKLVADSVILEEYQRSSTRKDDLQPLSGKGHRSS
jgi:hypothetical protein